MDLPTEGDAKTTSSEDTPTTRAALQVARAFVFGAVSEHDMMQALSLARAATRISSS